MIQLTDKLIAVIVPKVKDNRYFKLWDDVNKEWVIECQINNINNEYVRNLGNIEDYYIIGTITKSETNEPIFDFDCEKYVKKLDNGFGKNGEYKYKHYGDRLDSRFKTKEESFISLLQSKEIFLEELNNQKLLILEKL